MVHSHSHQVQHHADRKLGIRRTSHPNSPTYVVVDGRTPANHPTWYETLVNNGKFYQTNWLAGILPSTGIRSLWPWPLMLLHRYEHFIWLESLPKSISNHFQKNKDDMMIVQFLIAKYSINIFKKNQLPSFRGHHHLRPSQIPAFFGRPNSHISMVQKSCEHQVIWRWWTISFSFQDYTRYCKISSSNNNHFQNSVLHFTPHTQTHTYVTKS